MDRYLRRWGSNPLEAYIGERELGASVPSALIEFVSQLPGVFVGTVRAGLRLLPEMEAEGESIPEDSGDRDMSGRSKDAPHE